MIRYEQSAPITGQELTIGTSSEDYFILCLSRAFPNQPGPYWILDEHNLERLEGMKACYAEASLNPYSELIKAIKRLGSITVWRANDEKQINNS